MEWPNTAFGVDSLPWRRQQPQFIPSLIIPILAVSKWTSVYDDHSWSRPTAWGDWEKSGLHCLPQDKKTLSLTLLPMGKQFPATILKLRSLWGSVLASHCPLHFTRIYTQSLLVIPTCTIPATWWGGQVWSWTPLFPEDSKRALIPCCKSVKNKSAPWADGSITQRAVQINQASWATTTSLICIPQGNFDTQGYVSWRLGNICFFVPSKPMTTC